MLRVAFLIRSLDAAAGAERQLVELAAGLDKSMFDVSVVTYYPGGALAAELAAIPGVRLESVGKRGRGDVAGFLWRLVRTFRALNPDIVHGYMWGANELAWLLGKVTGARVVWGIRASNVDFSHYDWASRMLFRAGARLSKGADLIIANSHAGLCHHAAQGYRADRMVVIPNGIDVERFRPEAEARARVRAGWDLAPEHFAVGIVARLDPMKDHETFLRAAALVANRLPEARFVIVGRGAAEISDTLKRLAEASGLQDRVRWAGARQDMPAVYNAFDVAVSASAFGEGFANTLGEAMACEVPCVSTDVGDAAVVVGDTGRVVPPRRPDLLAAALIDLAAADRRALGRRARARIVCDYSTRALADRTSAALRRLVGQPGTPALVS